MFPIGRLLGVSVLSMGIQSALGGGAGMRKPSARNLGKWFLFGVAATGLVAAGIASAPWWIRSWIKLSRRNRRLREEFGEDEK